MIKHFKKLIQDTLMKLNDDGTHRYSRTSLTMFSAWITCITMSIEDYVQHGMDYQVFLTLVAVSLGSKLSDALSQKLNKQ